MGMTNRQVMVRDRREMRKNLLEAKVDDRP